MISLSQVSRLAFSLKVTPFYSQESVPNADTNSTLAESQLYAESRAIRYIPEITKRRWRIEPCILLLTWYSRVLGTILPQGEIKYTGFEFGLEVIPIIPLQTDGCRTSNLHCACKGHWSYLGNFSASKTAVSILPWAREQVAWKPVGPLPMTNTGFDVRIDTWMVKCKNLASPNEGIVNYGLQYQWRCTRGVSWRGPRY